MPGLGTSFGRGGATTAPSDLVNSDAILIMGSNMAENHPVGFQWVIEARERGAHVIHVDPRFSRTSAMATIWAPLRAGSDVLFLGGLINYVLDRGKEFREYVVHYTNASAILPDDVQDSEELGGLFSGWDPTSAQIRPERVVLSANAGRRHGSRRRMPRRPRVATRRTAEDRPPTWPTTIAIRRSNIPAACSRS